MVVGEMEDLDGGILSGMKREILVRKWEVFVREKW